MSGIVRDPPKKVGEEWRHCKGGHYIVKGFATDPDGDRCVIYADEEANATAERGLYVQKVSRWMERHEATGQWRFERLAKGRPGGRI